MTSAEKLIVIGGGIGGLVAISELRKVNADVDITLIEPKDFFEVPWSSIRGLIDADVAHSSTFSLKDWTEKHDVKLVTSYVTSMDESNINLANSRTIVDFDLVLIAVGATNPEKGFGRTTPGEGGCIEEGDRLDTMAKRGQQLLNCGSVAIVGGGLVGIELAGDLAYSAKQKEIPLHVTLIHSESRLAMADMTAGASKFAQKKLEKLGVTIHLNERCKVSPASKDQQNDEEGGASGGGGGGGDEGNDSKQHDLFLPNSGGQVSANEIIWTTGISSHNRFVHGKFKTFETGWIKVDDYFRVLGTIESKGNEDTPSKKYFAFGDCCDWFPNAGNALMQNGATIGHNLAMALQIKAQEKAKASGGAAADASAQSKKIAIKPFRKAKVPPRFAVATLGPKAGVASGIGCCGYTQFLIPGMKNKTMFLSNIKKSTGIE